MSGVSNVPLLPMMSSSVLNRVSGPATVRNIAKAAYQDKADGASQTGKSNQAAAVYQKDRYDYAAAIGSASGKSYTPETANQAAAKGTPTHGFFYHDIDALAQAAADSEKAVDASFARDTLDFFTGGNYKASDVDRLQGEMTTALKEMARQLEDTGSVDAGKLESRVTINGAKVSLGELAGFQEMGKRMSPVFDGISEDNTRFQDMQATAKMSVARLMGRDYGKTRGEIGAMFSEAVDRLYEKGMDRIDQLYTDGTDGLPASAASQDAAGLRKQVNGMFSSLNTSDKSVLGTDFSQKLGTLRDMMTQRDNQLGVPTAYRNASMAAKNVGLYFSALYRML